MVNVSLSFVDLTTVCSVNVWGDWARCAEGNRVDAIVVVNLQDIIRILYNVFFAVQTHWSYWTPHSSYNTSYQPLRARDFTSATSSVGSCTSAWLFISVCVSLYSCIISTCTITYIVNCCIQITRGFTSATFSVGNGTSVSWLISVCVSLYSFTISTCNSIHIGAG